LAISQAHEALALSSIFSVLCEYELVVTPLAVFDINFFAQCEGVYGLYWKNYCGKNKIKR
jgi:hypothetical protein